MTESPILTALAWAARGINVFPVWPARPNASGKLTCACPKGAECSPKTRAKHPLAGLDKNGRMLSIAPQGRRSATTEGGTIKHWWNLVPDANLGVDTQTLIVIDCDPRNGGDESWAALEREHELPPTWRTITGGLGEHVIFRRPPGLAVAAVHPDGHDARGNPTYCKPPPLGPGIDVVADDGYIISPPSLHICGRRYAWNVDCHPSEVPLADPPQWLLERLTNYAGETRRIGRTSPEEWARLTGTTITEYLDREATRIAGCLFAADVPAELIGGLMQSWNRDRCRPPLADDVLHALVDRIADLEMQKPWRRRP